MYWHDEKYKGRAITKELLIKVEHDVKIAIDHYAQRAVNSRLTAYHDGNDIILVAHNEETANYLKRISGERKPRYEIDDYVCVIESVREGKVIPAKVSGIRRMNYSDTADVFMYEVENEVHSYTINESEIVSIHEAPEIAKEVLRERLDFLETHYFNDGQWIEIPIMKED